MVFHWYNLRKYATNASNAAAEEKGKLESKGKELERAAKGIFGERPKKLDEAITAELCEIAELLTTLSTGIEEENQRCNQKADIEVKLPTLEKELVESGNVVTTNGTAIATLTTEISGLESTLKKLKKPLFLPLRKMQKEISGYSLKRKSSLKLP